MTLLERGRHTERLLNENIKGVAGIIVNRDGRLLVGTEQRDKPETIKQRGHLSIPMETLKSFELGTEAAMVKALLTEIATPKSMLYLRRGLQTAGVVSVVPLESDVHVAVMLLKWKGDPKFMPFGRAHPEEFSNLRWVGVKTFLDNSFVRPYARTVLSNTLELNRRKPSPIEFQDLDLRDYLPSSYENLRELVPDVEINIPKSEM
jgi:hypothetical protein